MSDATPSNRSNPADRVVAELCRESDEIHPDSIRTALDAGQWSVASRLLAQAHDLRLYSHPTWAAFYRACGISKGFSYKLIVVGRSGVKANSFNEAYLQAKKSPSVSPRREVPLTDRNMTSVPDASDDIGLDDLLKRLLTPREYIVVKLSGQGYTNLQIAARMDLTLDQVRWSISQARSKLRPHFEE